jgi:hypothetical protein
MKTRLTCPCGAPFTGTDEDDLVIQVQEHLRAAHPTHDYSRDEILFLAW